MFKQECFIAAKHFVALHASLHTALRLVPTAGGEIRLRGTDLVPLGERELRPLRRHVQMVFQDPYASLNPRRTVAEILDTVLVANGIGNAQQRRSRIATMLDRVGRIGQPDALLLGHHRRDACRGHAAPSGRQYG